MTTFRASGMPRIAACAGSFLSEQEHHSKSGFEASEGSLAHDHAAEHLSNGTSLTDHVRDLDMLAAIMLYVQVCAKYYIPGIVRGIEDSFSALIGGHTLTGTTDYFSWSPAGSMIVLDFKYGYGWVEVKDNWQLICYAVLMWLKYGNGAVPNTVRVGIVQPRANHPDGPIRYWDFPGEMLPIYRDHLGDIMNNASLPGAATVAGENCRYCKAILGCHTNRAACAGIAERYGTAMQSNLAGEDLARELDIIKESVKLITHRETALEAYALEKIKSGSIVPGYGGRQMLSSLKWDVPDPITAGYDIDVNLAQEPTPITPTQALGRKLLTEDQVSLMASRKPGAFKLQRNSLSFAKELIENA